jgi:hypothetical protein
VGQTGFVGVGTVRGLVGTAVQCRDCIACRDVYNTNYLKRTGFYTYHQFNIQQFYVLPTQCIYVFCVDLSRL